MKTAFVIGRMLFGGFFLYNGINHLKNPQGLVQYAGAKNVPNPDQAVTASGVAMLVGGASIILGLKPRWGALPISAFLSVVSPMMHDFWNAGEESKQGEMINFCKNMALLGAALMLAGVEDWPASVRA
jgi:uncharacterized membrane protein YphA (DoxX/SURF4 family)